MSKLLWFCFVARFEVLFCDSVQERPEDHLVPQLGTNCRQQNDSQVKHESLAQLFPPLLTYEGQKSEGCRKMHEVLVVSFLYMRNLVSTHFSLLKHQIWVGTCLLQQDMYLMEKGGDVCPSRHRQQGQSVKASFFTIRAQIIGFKTVTGEMGQIYCMMNEMEQ